MIKRIIIFCVLLSAISCKNDKQTITQNQLPKESQKEMAINVGDQFYMYKTVVSNLRLRPTPTTQGVIIKTLSKNQNLIVIEETPFKEKINIGGEERNEPWYKVFYDTDSLLAGWVYGGGIEIDTFANEKITILNDISTMELEGLMQLKGFDPEFDYYQGYYNKKELNQDSLLLEGLWFVKGKQLGQKGDEMFSQIYYSGHFVNGKKDGLWLEYIEYNQGFKRTEIVFDEGNCTSNISIYRKEELDEISNKPTLNCSF